MSHLSLHIHVVFATKHRESWIDKSWRPRLYEYLGGVVRGLGATSEGVGGIDDHVHMLIGFKSTHQLAEFMRELKKASSIWIHNQIGLKQFAWQEGYGAFSVSPTARESVQRYIANQEEHHRCKSSRDEYLELLRTSGIEFEEQYVE
jgi:REP element-mobilizing transposase RayT